MNRYDTLNKMQQEAVFYTEGPLLILAGAGSGKTRVLTHRAAYLIEEKHVNPYNIMAITFTNKAAGEMRERIDDLIGNGSDSIWVSTFHSACVRILRRHIERIGFTNNFSIYDADDQKSVIKDICKQLQIDTKTYKERTFLNAISSAKDELVSPAKFALNAGSDFNKKRQADVYREYQAALRKNNALDFDDLIVKCVELLREDEEVRNYYQERFRYVMVDEYQDTNTAQFQLVRLLAGKYNNLCVVGDDDQSIYKFRGANIHNILHFEQYFPNAKIIKLEQNYRSTQNILDAANAVIKNNKGRKEKALWTEKEAGAKISFREFESAYDEADFVAREISQSIGQGRFHYGDSAVLYRTNAQSRLMEEKFVSRNIPYKIVGGVNFYSRREIKDILAYLKTIDNAQDDLAVRRIINIPKRGIGATSINRIQDYAYDGGIGFFDALKEAEQIPSIGKASAKLLSFAQMIQSMRSKVEYLGLKGLVEDLLETTGYLEELETENTEESADRIENIDEFISKIASYEETAELPTLSGFLEEVSLVADIDSVDDNKDYVVLMTLHSAKGLEFPNVYLTGMEDGLFPSYMTITADDPSEMEEERRLCYVGITRAKDFLTITCARQRMQRGEMQYNRVSRFVEEIPSVLLSGEIRKPKIDFDMQNSWQSAKKAFRSPTAYQGTANAPKPGMGSAQNFQPAKDIGSPKGAPNINYGKGDRVKHGKFGEGTVTDIVAGGRDYEVTVDFDKFGTKKMFALFAKLNKL